jgi:hypothetical protein
VSAISAHAEGTEVAFRSARDEVVKAVLDYQADYEAHRQKLFAQMTAWGFADDHPVMVRPGTLGGASAVTGVKALDEDPPWGWRAPAAHPEAWVPRMNTRLGKEIAQQLEAVQPPRKSLLERLPGMPSWSMNGNRYFSPSVFLHWDTVYVRWLRNPEPEDKVDRDLWEQIRLSDWHLAKEAYDAANAAKEPNAEG